MVDKQLETHTAEHNSRYRGRVPEGCKKNWSNKTGRWYYSYSGKPPVWEDDVKRLRQLLEKIAKETNAAAGQQSAQELMVDSIRGLAIDSGENRRVDNAGEAITGIPGKAEKGSQTKRSWEDHMKPTRKAWAWVRTKLKS